MTARFLIVGCGGVGIVYTYVLSRGIPEKDIVAVCRSNHAVASADGFKLNSAVWGPKLQVKPIIVSTIDEAVKGNGDRPFDFILISSKCIGPKSAVAEMIKPAVTKGTVIVLLQNGIGIEAPYASLFPTNPIISAVVYVSCVQTSPAVVTHNDIQHLHIGTYPAEAPETHKVRAVQLADILTAAGASVQVHDDIQVERWSKALINSAWNPITALSRSGDASFLASSPDAVRMVREVMLEIAAVAQACGYQSINAELVEYQLGKSIARHSPGIISSMCVDAVEGRSMEVDAIVGNVIALASEKGVDVPLLRVFYILIKALNDSFSVLG